MSRILIYGVGNVGQHIANEFAQLKPYLYDIKYNKDELPDLKIIYDYAFVCVPTEKNTDGTCNTSIVEEAVNNINAQIIIIKSTIPVGMTEMLQSKHLDKQIIFSPEYYGTTIHSPNNPNFVILGGDKQLCAKVAELYYQIKPNTFQIQFTDSKTAELVKYMENSFLALKVTFCSEFYQIAKAFGIVYPELRELFLLDERMGSSHTFVNSEQPFYDSHCLNKDIPALITQCENIVATPLMTAVNDININTKQQYRKD